MCAQIRGVKFNRDGSCFAFVDENGFRVFNSNPIKEICHVEMDGRIQIVEPIFRSGLIALVGDGSSAVLPMEKVCIYDCHRYTITVQLNVRSAVRNLSCQQNRIVVATQQYIYVYTLADIPECLFYFETYFNPFGLFAIFGSQTFIAFPAHSCGFVGIIFDSTTKHNTDKIIRAHRHNLQTISISPNATASVKGTLIRLFDLPTMTLISEFRRGNNPAYISITFSDDSSFLCVGSDRPTLHVFCTKKQKDQQNKSFLKRYFTSQENYLRLSRRSSNGTQLTSTQIAIYHENIIAIDSNGNYSKFEVDLDRSTISNSSHRDISVV
ncbi:hypothetical protein M3Y98_00292600 [Aphelenchoides besseyi]|nr:hypothetical protein M3Y98_00292600 [Aphelenchoides besseyi]KAI6201145.1 hypothetical protein M3Y96_00810300 [Aphelenchoides besseyi]